MLRLQLRVDYDARVTASFAPDNGDSYYTVTYMKAKKRHHEDSKQCRLELTPASDTQVSTGSHVLEYDLADPKVSYEGCSRPGSEPNLARKTFAIYQNVAS